MLRFLAGRRCSLAVSYLSYPGVNTMPPGQLTLQILFPTVYADSYFQVSQFIS